ncbi:MAG: BtpA/SgcQ family protein, partial [Myxococcales bacterium]|nr:BtpA/SgcQ family protein [Myxococcales bacterium]
MKLTPGGGCAFIGMVHLDPLPGSPRWAGDMRAVIERARRDAAALIEGGCDALLVENMGDVPYLRGAVPPETVAAMARAVAAITDLGHPTGVQILAAANREALGVAVACGASFIRVEAFAYAHVADEGWLDACAGDLLRARRALGADVSIWADVQKKHAAHAVTADLSMAELAKGAAFCVVDALVVTGVATGRPTALADVTAARA